MDDFNSETDSDYTSYWRDWVSTSSSGLSFCALSFIIEESFRNWSFYSLRLHWSSSTSGECLISPGLSARPRPALGVALYIRRITQKLNEQSLDVIFVGLKHHSVNRTHYALKKRFRNKADGTLVRANTATSFISSARFSGGDHIISLLGLSDLA